MPPSRPRRSRLGSWRSLLSSAMEIGVLRAGLLAVKPRVVLREQGDCLVEGIAECLVGERQRDVVRVAELGQQLVLLNLIDLAGREKAVDLVATQPARQLGQLGVCATQLAAEIRHSGRIAHGGALRSLLLFDPFVLRLGLLLVLEGFEDSLHLGQQFLDRLQLVEVLHLLVVEDGMGLVEEVFLDVRLQVSWSPSPPVRHSGHRGSKSRRWAKRRRRPVRGRPGRLRSSRPTGRGPGAGGRMFASRW